jgi:chromosomal replication initiation ATPase DnaA
MEAAFIIYQNTHVPSFKIDSSSNKWIIDRIKKAIFECTGLEFSEYNVRERKRNIALTRQVFFYLTRLNTTLSLKEIGGQFSYNYYNRKTKKMAKRNYDHSTVIHGIATINAILDSYDCAEKNQVTEIINNFKKIWN